jgi:hypothetical protein
MAPYQQLQDHFSKICSLKLIVDRRHPPLARHSSLNLNLEPFRALQTLIVSNQEQFSSYFIMEGEGGEREGGREGEGEGGERNRGRKEQREGIGKREGRKRRREGGRREK